MKQDKKPILSSISRGKLTDLTIEEIKELIFSGNIKEGEKLPSERDLSNQLGISRSVVREALSSLEHAGLVEIRRGRGAGAFIVNNLHKPLYHSTVNMMKSGKIDIQHFINARKAIECYSLRQIEGKLTPDDLKKLEEIDYEFISQYDGKRGKQKLKIDFNDKAQDANTLFHLTLSQFSENPLLTMMLHSLLDLMKANRHSQDVAAKHYRSKVHHVHREIVDAMRQNDWMRAEQCLVENIDSTKDLYLGKPMVKKRCRDSERRI
mgnify:CR=1 FL=1